MKKLSANSFQLSAVSAQPAGPDTERVYKEIADHGEGHRVAIENMTKAMARGDVEAMQKFFDEAKYHEQMQRQAGIEARKYFLRRASHEGMVKS